MITLHEDSGLSALSNSGLKFDDGELIEGLRANSVRAWTEIIAVYRRRIFAAALRFTRNYHDAEDITQETFVRAFRGAASFRGDSSLNTWLHAIATNLMRNRYWYWRRRKRDETVSLESATEFKNARMLEEALGVDDSNAAERSEKDDLLQQLEKGMVRLHAWERQVLTMRDRHGATYDEVSRALRIPIGTVKSRIARARAHLRAIVNANLSGETDLLVPQASL